MKAILCVDDKELNSITIGKVYDLIEYPHRGNRNHTIYRFRDNQNNERSYDLWKNNFIEFDKNRDQKINKILGE